MSFQSGDISKCLFYGEHFDISKGRLWELLLKFFKMAAKWLTSELKTVRTWFEDLTLSYTESQSK